MKIKEIHLPTYGIDLYESKHHEGNKVHEHHHDFHQILYAIEGQGEIIIDGKSHDFFHDQFALIVPSSKHAILSHSRLTLLVLAFDMDALGSFGKLEWEDEMFEKSRFFTPDLVSRSELRLALRKMLYELKNRDPFSTMALKIHLLHILLHITRLHAPSQIQDINTIRTERIKNYIDTYYYEPLTTKDIANRLGISSRYVNTIFKDYYKKTPMQYLAEVRIEVAKKLLTESDKDIVTICFEVGYETLSTFYRIFKNITQVSPNQYRKLHQHQ